MKPRGEQLNKRELRNCILNELQDLDIAEINRIELNIMKKLFAHPFWKQANRIGITLSYRNEWNTVPIIERAWSEGKEICVPKTDHVNKRLLFYKITQFDDIEVGFAHIREPNPERTALVRKHELDLVIVPGVVFDRSGYRIGYGGGYYDRFLQHFTSNTLSLCSEMQLVPTLPVEPHDIPVHYLITDKNVIKAVE